VVGFDDIQSAAYSTPSLSSVRQPLLEMGKRGAQILLDRIANSGNKYPSEIVMATELVVRESTGQAPAQEKP
jgi:LacI family transcriptional regulator